MIRLPRSVAFRLALAYGALVIAAMTLMATAIYLGTIGVVERGIDKKLRAMSTQLAGEFTANGLADMRQRIETFLTDKVDQDTEVYLLLGPGGSVVGNISRPRHLPSTQELSDETVTRYGQRSYSRLLSKRLPDGYVLVVGRDLTDLVQIRRLVVRSMVIGGTIAVLFAIGGAWLFRRQLEARIGTIRRTAERIAAGNLGDRIPEGTGSDEFTKLDRSINQMLDRIQTLMDGVRDVSNAIAHDLRTPLGRIRSLLDEGIAHPHSAEAMADRARTAIRSIDELTSMFDKLLQIAEAESGARRQSFRPVMLSDVILDVVELYDATAEERGISLVAGAWHLATALGDRELLASAVANLVDNALKYAPPGTTVSVGAAADRETASIIVQDNGPGIPENERAKVVARFYRLDRSRSLPGNGLGLPIVSAICRLHGGSLSLEDGHPGLLARIVLPRTDAASSQEVGVPAAAD